MRCVFITALVVVGTAAPIFAQQPSYPQFETRVHKDGDKALPYRLLIPKDYKPGEALPLIVWLHGSGENGTNNTSQVQSIASTFLADPGKCPAFVLVPQCPPKMAWHGVGFNKPAAIPDSSRLLIAVIAELKKEFGLDERRLYVGGFSMGGCGTWELVARYPQLFAAAFPIAGPPGERKGLAPWIKHVPIWVFHGDKDRLAPVDMSRTIVAALKEAGGNVKYTEYAGGGHECLRPLNDPELTRWLFAQKRTAAADFTPVTLPDDVALVVKTLPEGTRGTWSAKVERTGHGAARIPIDNIRYRLKPAKNAEPGIAATLARIGKGELTGEYTVTGVVELSDYAWLAVERIDVKK